MTTTYHGSPITPRTVLELLCERERHFCVSYFRPDQVEIIARLASSWFIDCGAFSAWRQGLTLDREYWAAYYVFVRHWLERGAAWFVIPDVIDAGTQEQDALLRECPSDLLPHGWPVWHMDEPISRLLSLIERFGRVCIGSTAEYAVVGSPAWRGRMDEIWNAIWAAFGCIPPVHMFRGMQCLLPSFDYPFARVDSTDMGRNHCRLKVYGDRYHWAVVQKANRWDALNCPATWPPPRLQIPDLFAA